MNYNDLFLTNLLFNYLNKININSGNIIIDIIIINFITLFIFLLNNNYLKLLCYNIFTKLFNFYFDKTNKIIFCSTEKQQSKKFRAIMHYLSTNNSNNIKSLMEIIKWKYENYVDESAIEESSYYRVEQNNTFSIDNNIYGKIYHKEKMVKNNDYREYIYFELFSKKLSVLELQSWINIKIIEYNNYLLNKNNNQLLIDIYWDNKTKDIEVYHYNWVSNVTFDNRFFTNKNNILNNINFFLNNELWYKERGIPYTLGFLLWGNPGCGKTGFIKALMNLTNFNAIVIKLNSNFNFIKLKDIIYNEEINNDLIIPLQKRIIIFEDIDCMTDIINDRTIINNNDKEEKNKILNNNSNNNLSYLLNLLDGLHECHGRIIIMTTNIPNILDKALIRPGRIDYIINFTNATCQDIIDILNYYWNTNYNYDFNNDLNFKYTHAEIVNFCKKSVSFYDTINIIIK